MARLKSSNILHFAPDAKRLWLFDAKGNNFVLGRELRAGHTEKFASKFTTKSWTTFLQPKMNIAWLPPESVFLKVIELPASNFDELFTMVEFQLEKISPVPPAQIVWTMHLLPTRRAAPVQPAAEAAVVENLQTVVVVIVDRAAVEQFLGKLAEERFQPDRLEVPLLDQLDAIITGEDGVWILPLNVGNQSTALTVWQGGGALRHLSFIHLPATGDRAAELKHQLELITWSGEVEGWLAESPQWHLVADPALAAVWEPLVKSTVEANVRLSAPVPPAELATRTARRAAAASPKSNLMPAEHLVQYRQQFVDRLWLQALFALGAAYILFLIVYFSVASVLGLKASRIQQEVAGMGAAYTNALQLEARYDVLKQRQDLKFAALDCWKLVAENLPEGLMLQRFGFADGKDLSLSGTCSADQINLIADKDRFYDRIRKAQKDGQTMFSQDPTVGSQLLYRQIGANSSGNYSWNFGVELMRAEADQLP
jgi:hypothetical protein